MLLAGEDEGTLPERALWLGTSPCSPLEMETPDEATKALFGWPMLRLVKG
jgi:hypothetical protein